MCDSCVTEFTSFFGTGILGMWVTFKNTAVDSAGTIDASTELAMDFDIRLYAASASTETSNVFDAPNADLDFYLLFINPYASGTTSGNNTDQSVLQYDAVYVRLDVVNG